ncbi:polyprenyl synthetase family protein [Candidatus Omnitrophota bacterium]
MHNKIKNKIEKKLPEYIKFIDKTYRLSRVSPLLSQSIEEFILRKGKRVRPILFIISYLGFAKKVAPGLYTSALSVELLHDFLLVHDDIIDKSDTRRGKPSMHMMLGEHLKNHKQIKFSSQDLAIICGDVMYAMAIDSFLAIKETMIRKERGLRQFTKAAFFTGTGEFLELMDGLKDIAKIDKQDIYRIYDYKTAHYTFCSPLTCGAFLAGASQRQVDRLYKFGIYLGRAFQIKDDLLGLFSDQQKIGKSPLTDLQEAKKTLPLWHAYHHSTQQDRLFIKRLFNKKLVTNNDLKKVRRLVYKTGSLDYAEKQILDLTLKAHGEIQSCAMRPKYKTFLKNYAAEILQV